MKQRIISAFFLILIAIPLIISGGKTFSIMIGFLGLFGLKEIFDLKRKKNSIPIFMSLLFAVCLLTIIYIVPLDFANMSISLNLLSLFFLIYLLPSLFYSSKYKIEDAFYFLAITLFLGLACHNIILMRMDSIWLFLYMLLVPILTDTFAYFFGFLLGRIPLAPFISPKKTVEGSIFCTFLATLICSTWYYIFVSPISIFQLLGVTLLFSMISQIGDLLFSKIKRENGVKDFSNLIPGHGGILDRFDSFILVSLAYSLLQIYL